MFKLFWEIAFCCFLVVCVGISCGEAEQLPAKSGDSGEEVAPVIPEEEESTEPETPAENQFARRMCERVLACVQEMVCTQQITINLDACIADATSRGADEAQALAYEGMPCDDINLVQCGNSQIASVCECPMPPQGSCPEGEYCSVALTTSSGTLYACGTEAGAKLPDAPTCGSSGPACEEGFNCVGSPDDPNTGTCLMVCER